MKTTIKETEVKVEQSEVSVRIISPETNTGSSLDCLWVDVYYNNERLLNGIVHGVEAFTFTVPPGWELISKGSSFEIVRKDI